MAGEFIEAVKRGDRALVERMLEQDGSHIADADNGTSALLLAYYHGHPEVGEVIRANQPELDLYEASTVGDTGRIREIAATNAELVNAHAPDGFTALGLAAFFRQPAAVRLLIELGADPHLASREGAFTPLHSAVADDAGIVSKEMVRALLEAGADPNAPSASGGTPLHTAAFTGNVEVTKLLLAAGGNPNMTDAKGTTPLDVARDRGKSEVAALLHDAVIGKTS